MTAPNRLVAPTAAVRLRARVEERAVELQATTADAVKTADALFAYDRRENDRHLTLRHADDRTADIIEQQLLVGDVAEAAYIQRLRDRLDLIGSESHALAGELTRYWELRDQRELFPEATA